MKRGGYASMTSCSMLLQTFSRRCRSSCMRSEGGHLNTCCKFICIDIRTSRWHSW